MNEQQPSITSPDEYEASKHTLEDINTECAGREQDVFQARHDPAKLDRARTALSRIYHIRQGLLDALRDYEHQHVQSQRNSDN